MFARCGAKGLVGLVALGVLVAFVVGCGPKPPCAVPPTQVKDAQAKTAGVQDSLSKVQAEKASLEKTLAQKQADLARAKTMPDDLQKKLDNLKKGSGR